MDTLTMPWAPVATPDVAAYDLTDPFARERYGRDRLRAEVARIHRCPACGAAPAIYDGRHECGSGWVAVCQGPGVEGDPRDVCGAVLARVPLACDALDCQATTVGA